MPTPSEKTKPYPDGKRIYLIYRADLVPPADTDEAWVYLVEDTEQAARNADMAGAIYEYTFKDGAACNETFVGLTKLAEHVS